MDWREENGSLRVGEKIVMAPMLSVFVKRSCPSKPIASSNKSQTGRRSDVASRREGNNNSISGSKDKGGRKVGTQLTVADAPAPGPSATFFRVHSRRRRRAPSAVTPLFSRAFTESSDRRIFTETRDLLEHTKASLYCYESGSFKEFWS